MLIPHQEPHCVYLPQSMCMSVFDMKWVFIFTRDLSLNIFQGPGELAVERNHISMS